MRLSLSFTVLFALLLPALATAQTSRFSAKPSGQILTAGDNRLVILSPAGMILWEHPAKLVHDAWMLPSGNVLFADGAAVTELTPDKKVVFAYTSPAKRHDAVYACQRLPNGHTLIGENATGRILEVDPAGKVAFSLQTQPFTEGQHQNLRMVRKLASGNYLVCHSGAHLVKEYKPDGTVVLELRVPNLAFAAIRTPQNTTLVSSLGQVTEFDSGGRKVWEFATKDLPDTTITNLTGMHLLPSGNLVLGCYAAYTKDGQGCGLLEITRDRKLVWAFRDAKFARTMMPVQMLDEKGRALPGECLR